VESDELMKRLGGWFATMMDWVVLGCMGIAVVVVLGFVVWSIYRMVGG
jgi:hypothetical protein